MADHSSSDATVSSPETYTESERLENLRLIQEANVQAHPNNVRPVGSIKKQKLHHQQGRRTANQSKVSSTVGSPAQSISGEELFCICHKPDNGEWMIACDFCDQWFHGSCIKLDETDSPLIIKYCCPICEEKGRGPTLWRRKCRLDGCKNPVEEKTKYCSRAHGILFFRHKLLVYGGAKYSNQLNEGMVASVIDYCVQGDNTNNGGWEKFSSLGNNLPDVSENDILMEMDQKGLDRVTSKKEALERDVEGWQNRLQYLKLAKERVKRINEELTRQDPNSKKKDICGMDMVFVDDKKGPEIIAAKSKLEALDDRDGVCLEEKRKCVKHKDWAKIVSAEAEVGINQSNHSLTLLEEHINELKQQAKIRASYQTQKT